MYRVEDTLWWYVGMRAVVRALVGDRLDSAGRILDAGCGTGGNLAWWQRRVGPRVGAVGTGVDLSPDALAFGTRRGLTRLARASVSAGMVVDRATYANALLFPAAVASRILTRGNHGTSGASGHVGDVASDVRPASAVVQAIGMAALHLEAGILRGVDLPFGLSAIVVATRPVDAH